MKRPRFRPQPQPHLDPHPRPRRSSRFRLRLRWLVPLAFLLLPPLLWSMVLSVVPTAWARERVVAGISEASGRSVRLATVRVGALGGIYLTGLEIGAPGAGGDPWLKVAEAYINVSPLQLICGQVEPTETRVRGLTLRVLRRQDGTLELDDLIHAPADSSAAPNGARPGSCPLSRLDLRIRDADVTLIDAPTGTHLEFREVAGRATWEGTRATIQELRGTLNDGTFEVVAQLDRSAATPAFEGHVRAQGIELNERMSALGYLVPVLAHDEGTVDGTLDINLYLRGQGTSRAELRRTVVGHGAVSLDPIGLDGSRFLTELASFVESPSQGRLGSVKSDFTIQKGRIVSENLTLDITKVPIVLSGWTDFDGKVSYKVRGDSLVERLPSKARDLLADLSIDGEELSALKVEGPLDAPRITYDGVPVNQHQAGRTEPDQAPAAAASHGDDRQRLRELGRRLRDRVFR
jgi:hypothetical protein